MHRQHRAWRRTHHSFGNTTQHNARKTRASVRAHDNEVDVGGLGVLKNLAGRFVTLFHDRDRPVSAIGVGQTVLEPARGRLFERAPVDDGGAQERILGNVNQMQRGIETVGDTVPSPWGPRMEFVFREIGGVIWLQITLVVLVLRMALSMIAVTWRRVLHRERRPTARNETGRRGLPER